MNLLCESQTAAQRTIAKHINGYPLWFTGEIAPARWDRLVEKFMQAYETDISPSARQWRKKRGQCCAHLIAAPQHSGKIRWVMLVTEHGSGAVKENEVLHDSNTERLVWDDYVLIRTTRPRKVGGGSHWTWFMTPQVERREANYLCKLAQTAGTNKRPHELKAFTETLLRRPLHAGVRQQVGKMFRRAQKVWAKHSQGMSWPGPDPASLPHVGHYRSLSSSQDRSETS